MLGQNDAVQAPDTRLQLSPTPWIQIQMNSALGTPRAQTTRYIGTLPLFATPRIQATQRPE